MTNNTSGNDVIGVVIIARHGDREGFYQDPETYTSSSTAITPLGVQQEFQLGALLRSLYLNASSPSFIQGATPSTELFNTTQVIARADAGDEGFVIYDSAIALVQGLWPPTNLSTTRLANGTNITSPLDGYQYIPVESVELDQDVTLEGFADCPNFDANNDAFFNSTGFLQMQTEFQPFLDELPPFLDGRPVTLENMHRSQIFDYMNVQSIHNETFFKNLPPAFLVEARYLANWHEYNIFSDTTPGGIGNIAIQTMLPTIIEGMQDITNSSTGLKIHYSAISYKPFLSLFNVTGVINNGALPEGIVNYAAAVVYEIRQTSSSSEPVIRMQFKNGTDDDTFRTIPMTFPGWDGTTSGGDVPVSTFINAFQPITINTTLEWCNICAQTTERGCAALIAGSTTASTHHDRISPVGAGFLGAGLTIVVMAAAIGVLIFLGVLSTGAGKKHRRAPSGSNRSLHSDEAELHSQVCRSPAIPKSSLMCFVDVLFHWLPMPVE
ncbi:phosphoglycerate mutase-like protein [Obba rivulosa]|uniref:Phosphoglycerate mutase-like protein n=1 Tax=Obba rivulosa TaxID=1052685 RepID=A0A8E2AUA5_9APHY|nr:phosphoglycerate mutase-like protein [Obba rivulosa]